MNYQQQLFNLPVSSASLSTKPQTSRLSQKKKEKKKRLQLFPKGLQLFGACACRIHPSFSWTRPDSGDPSKRRIEKEEPHHTT
jgi:hypothetical protein